MKKIIYLLALLSLVLSGCGKEKISQQGPYPAYEKEGARQGWGYIDGQGKYIIGPKYDLAQDFEDGLAIVGLDNKFGLIDGQGLEILKTEFTSLKRLGGGYFAGQREGRLGLYHRDGPIELDGDYLSLGAYRDGRIRVAQRTSQGISFGYIDARGQLKLPLIYDQAYDFNQGQALVRKANSYQLINTRNRARKLADYRSIRPLEASGLFLVSSKGDKYGLIDGSLRKLLEEEYEGDIELVGDYIVASKTRGGQVKKGLLSRQGEKILDFNYREIRDLGQGYLALDQARDQASRPSYKILGPDLKALAGSYDQVHKSQLNMDQGLISVEGQARSYLIDLDAKIYQGLEPIAGQGLIEFDGQIFKSLVDGKLVYYNMEEERIWEEDTRFRMGDGVELVEKYVDKNNYQLTYPHLIGLKDDQIQAEINKFLLQEFMDQDPELAYESYRSSYRPMIQGGLLVLVRQTESRQADGFKASRQVYHIDLETGKNYDFLDLFRQDRLGELEAYLAARLGKNYRLGPGQDFIIEASSLYIIDNDNNLDGSKSIYGELDLDLKELEPYLDQASPYFTIRNQP